MGRLPSTWQVSCSLCAHQLSGCTAGPLVGIRQPVLGQQWGLEGHPGASGGWLSISRRRWVQVGEWRFQAKSRKTTSCGRTGVLVRPWLLESESSGRQMGRRGEERPAADVACCFPAGCSRTLSAGSPWAQPTSGPVSSWAVVFRFKRWQTAASWFPYEFMY